MQIPVPKESCRPVNMNQKNRKLLKKVLQALSDLELLTLKQASLQLPYCESRLYKLATEGDNGLPFVRLPLPGDTTKTANRIFIPKSELEAFREHRESRSRNAAYKTWAKKRFE